MRLVGLLLALLVVFAPVRAAEPVKGSLVIAGGEFLFDNPGWQRLVVLAGGKDARILVFPTASGDPQASGGRVVAHLRSLGAKAELVPLAEKGFDRSAHEVAHDPDWAVKARGAGGFFFVGGDQERYIKALRTVDGTDTPLLRAVWDAYRRGAVVAGSSAGAAIMSDTMFKSPGEPIDLLASGPEAGRTLDRGLGFIGKDWFVDQHFLARGRFARTLVAMDAAGYKRGVGIDENTALVITGGTSAEVVGVSGVVVLDTSNAVRRPGWPFTQTGAVLTLLRTGDRLDLTNATVTPAPLRAQGRIDPTAPDFRPYYDGAVPAFTGDMLAPWQLSELLVRTLDSKVGTASGLAFTDRPGLPGFLFTLTRRADSVGWAGAGTSVQNIQVDVAPVTMASPLFQVR